VARRAQRNSITEGGERRKGLNVIDGIGAVGRIDAGNGELQAETVMLAADSAGVGRPRGQICSLGADLARLPV
jgi:hypothetical protein